MYYHYHDNLYLILEITKTVFIFSSLKHPAKYIGRKPRKYTIPAKPLAPIQQQTPDGGPEQVRMYREPSSGALHPSQYIRVSLASRDSCWSAANFLIIFTMENFGLHVFTRFARE